MAVSALGVSLICSQICVEGRHLPRLFPPLQYLPTWVISCAWVERICPGVSPHVYVGGESLPTYMWGGQKYTHCPYMWRNFAHTGHFLKCMGGENFSTPTQLIHVCKYNL